MSFWKIYKFTEEYKYNDYISFSEGNMVVLVHKDSKYDHTFACKGIRGVILFPNNIFDKLELTTDKHARYFKDIT